MSPPRRHRVSVDLDGVCHDYLHGYGDGTIYGNLVPGANEALRGLLVDFDVLICTARDDLKAVAEWITLHTGIDTVAEQPHRHRITVWEPGTVLVTNRKVPALVYLDDRAVVFRDWRQALADIYTRSNLPPWRKLMEDLDHTLGHDVQARQARLVEEIRDLYGDDPATAVAAISDALHRPAELAEVRAARSGDDLETKTA